MMKMHLKFSQTILLTGLCWLSYPALCASKSASDAASLARWANAQNSYDMNRGVSPIPNTRRAIANTASNISAYPNRDPQVSAQSMPSTSVISVQPPVAKQQPSFSTIYYSGQSPRVSAIAIQPKNDLSVSPSQVVTQNSVNQAEEVTKPISQSSGSPVDTASEWMVQVAKIRRSVLEDRPEIPVNNPAPASYNPNTSSTTYYSQPISESIAIAKTTSKPPALGTGSFYDKRPATISCVIQAANMHNVPAYLLLAIASKEGGRNGTVANNVNTSSDLGHFQINTVHFGKKEVFRDINIEDVRWRGCYNAELAAWILNQRLQRTDLSKDFWTRAAGYHSWTPNYNAIYKKGLYEYAIRWQKWLNQSSNKPMLAGH